MYLWRRGGRYWFRKAVPIDLADILGRTEVRCSLATSERAVAQKRALAMLVALEQVYEVLRSERPLEPTKRLLGTFVVDFGLNGGGSDVSLHAASDGLRSAVTTLAAPAPEIMASGDQTLVPLDAIGAIFKNERPRGEANQAASDLLQLALAIRREKGWSRPERAKALVRLCQKLVAVSEDKPFGSPQGWAAVREIIREEIAAAGIGTTINQGPPFDTDALRNIVASGVRSGVSAAGRDRWSDELLSTKIGEFLAQKKEAGTKHKEDVERRLQAFLDFIGDMPIRDVTRDQIKEYRDVLDQLPPQFELRLGTKDMRDALEKNARRKKPFAPIMATTINLKWLGPVIRFFRWLVLEEKIEKNPTDGVRSQQVDREAANSKRLPFKPEHINKIFAITCAESPKTAIYWLPLLMMCTGARPNELAQLRTDDLDKKFNGQPHLNALCLIDDEDEIPKPSEVDEEKNKQSIKSSAGRRMIPLHPILIEAGFVRFIDERHNGSSKPLFRELKPNRHGNWAAAIGKRINGIIRNRLGRGLINAQP
jgi:integrase